jgi:hypothetical protein
MEKVVESPVYGLVAEFSDTESILSAANHAREAGYTKMDAYSPFPVHGLAEAIGFNDIHVPWIIFISGVLGAILGFGMEVYCLAVDYPLNVGGRPLVSWPSFIPVAYETTILSASFGAFLGMLAMNGLPRPHHPIFNTPRFEMASVDKFFLCIEANDPMFDIERTEQFLETLGPDAVSIVEK